MTGIVVRGLPQLNKTLQQLGPVIAQKIGDQALKAAAQEIADEAYRLAPVDTGALRESIVVVSGRRAQKLAHVYGIRVHPKDRISMVTFEKPESRRAHLAEFGTRHSAATPFLRNAMRTKTNDAFQAVVRTMERGIKREVKKLAKPLR
jgi:HK97 gp10 family phage protein